MLMLLSRQASHQAKTSEAEAAARAEVEEEECKLCASAQCLPQSAIVSVVTLISSPLSGN